MKKCPFCHADIEDSAQFCLYCMQPLTEKEQITLRKKKKPHWALIIAALFCISLIPIFALFGKHDSPTDEFLSESNQQNSALPPSSTDDSGFHFDQSEITSEPQSSNKPVLPTESNVSTPTAPENSEPEPEVSELESDVGEPEPESSESEPDVSEPVSSEVSKPEPEVSEPTSSESGKPEPEVSESDPEISEPESSEVSNPEPEVSESASSEASVSEPDVSESEPEISEPVSSEVSAPEPDVSEPEPDVSEPEPDVSEPEPDVSEPDPDVSEPDPEPEIHEHSFTLKNAIKKYMKSEGTCSLPPAYYYSCSCGQKGTESFYWGEANGHDLILEPGYPADCVNPGLTDETHCSICGNIFTAHREIAPLGHTFALGDSSCSCINCGAKGSTIIEYPDFPTVVRNTFRINSGTYNLKPIVGGKWLISFTFSYTNISSDQVILCPNVSLWGVTSLNCSHGSLNPNETGTLEARAQISTPNATYKLVFE